MKKTVIVFLIGFACILTFTFFLITEMIQTRTSSPEFRLAWQPESQNFAVCGDGSLIILNSNLDRVNQRNDIRKPIGGEMTLALSWDSTGKRLLYASDFIDVGIWNLETDILTHFSNSNFPAAWSKGRNLIATGNRNQEIEIRNGTTYEVEIVLPRFTYALENYLDLVYSLDWSVNGNFLASKYSSGNVRVWNTETGELVFQFDGEARSVSWGQDTNVAIALKDKVEIWDTQTGDLVKSIPIRSDIIRWNPSGSQIVTSMNEIIQVWDIDDSIKIRELEAHSSRISDIQWSADGTIFVSVDVSGIINIWDASSGVIINSVKID